MTRESRGEIVALGYTFRLKFCMRDRRVEVIKKRFLDSRGGWYERSIYLSVDNEEHLPLHLPRIR